MENNEKLWRIPEAADRLAIKSATLRRWLLLRKIAHVKLGARAVRIPQGEIDRLLADGYVPARKVGR
jgi:excisionase family DNA binding protein